MRLSLVVAATVTALLAAPPAVADQRDPRLPPLFAELAATPDSARAAEIDAEIWRIWLQSGDAEIDLLVERGRLALSVGLTEVAIRAFDEVTRRHPAFAEGWNKRATALYLAGRLDESAADVMRTIELEPRHYGALSGMGLIEVERERPAEAIAWYQRALGLNPHLVHVREALRRLRAATSGRSI